MSDRLWVRVWHPATAERLLPGPLPCHLGDVEHGPNCPAPAAYLIVYAVLPGWDVGPVTFACPEHTAMMRAERTDLAQIRTLHPGPTVTQRDRVPGDTPGADAHSNVQRVHNRRSDACPDF